VDLEVDLDPARAVFQMPEGGLAHGAQQNQPPGETVHRRVFGAERLQRRPDRTGTIEPIGERGDAPFDQLRQLLAPCRLDEAGHAACLPKRLRYASMNGSRSPSITFWTSATFSSVRWSLTMVYGWNTYERIWLPQEMSVFCLSTSAFFASRSAAARSYRRALSILSAVALFLN